MGPIGPDGSALTGLVEKIWSTALKDQLTRSIIYNLEVMLRDAPKKIAKCKSSADGRGRREKSAHLHWGQEETLRLVSAVFQIRFQTIVV